MTGKTHISVGLLAGLALTRFGVVANGSEMVILPFIASCGIGATLPDIDHHNSTITKKTGVIGKAISGTSKHRGFYHSALSIVLLYMATLLLTSKIEENLAYSTIVLGIIAFLILLPYITKALGITKKFNSNQFNMLLALIAGTAVISIIISGKPLILVMSSIFEGLVVGAASHIIADALNPKGVPLLWPIPGMIKFPIISITTGTPAETGIMVVCNLTSMYFIYIIIKEGIPLW